MNKKLEHRGPDQADIKLIDHVGMGFTRLSIIDLLGGMQQLYNEDHTIVLICNGEIFNYIELNDELSRKGHIFRTKSDFGTSGCRAQIRYDRVGSGDDFSRSDQPENFILQYIQSAPRTFYGN